MQREQKIQVVKWTALVLAIVLVISGVVTALVLGLNSRGQSADNQGTVADNDFTEKAGFEIANSENVRLALSAPVVKAATATTPASVSKTITATVMPADAPDKSIDWKVEWITNPFGESVPVSDYLTVTPQSDGSNVATITAHKGFEGGRMLVTATTRVGGFTATCTVFYEGAPEKIFFEYDGKIYDYSGERAKLTAGNTYTVKVNMSNTLGQVGSRYGKYEVKSISGTGKFVATKKEIVNGTVTSETQTNLEFKEYINEFISCTLEGDQLKINVKKSVSAFRYPNAAVRTGTQYTYYGPFTDPRSGGVPDKCIAYVCVRDTVSNKEVLFYIDIIATISSITLNNTTLGF